MIALLLSIMAMGASVEAPPLAIGDPFPPLTGEFLTGRSVTLPADVAGRRAVLFMGFTYASRSSVEAWGAWYRRSAGSDGTATFFEMPMIGGFAKLGRWFIDSGMRRGTPPELHEHVITVYAGSGDWKRRLGVTSANDRDAFVLLLDEAGIVRWLYHGGFSEEAAAELQARLAQAGP